MFNPRYNIISHHPLKNLNTWCIGGDAEYFYQPQSIAELADWVCEYPNTPKTLLGLGSNVLVADSGIPGVVIHLRPGCADVRVIETGLLYAEAGVACAKLAKCYARAGLLGGAFFSGIPGTLGGALAMNAGAFGGETWQLVKAVDVITPEGDRGQLPASAFTPGYRSLQGPKGVAFVGAYLSGLPGDTTQATGEIKSLLLRRKASQPIGTRNCGSVFKNPMGYHSAALIEQAGLKGMSVGGAKISEKHANFIINEGTATAEDVAQLITDIQETVFQQFNVRLETEVKRLG